MAKVLLPLVYRVLADFDRPVKIGLSPQEYKTLDLADLPKEEVLLDRSYQVTEACNAPVRGFSVAVKAGKKIKDVALAQILVNQDKPVVITLTLRLTEGLILPEVIGKALKEAYPDLLEEQEVKAEAAADEAPETGRPGDPESLVPPAPAPAKPAAAKGR